MCLRHSPKAIDCSGIIQPRCAQTSPVSSSGSSSSPVRGTDTYNSEDRLTRRIGNDGAQVEIVYNGDGHKVQETVTRNGLSTVTSYLVDELNPTGHAQVIEEYTNGTLTRVYTYGHQLLSQDQLLSSGDWNVSFYGYDGHGSIRFLTDTAGSVTDRYDYDAYGTLLSIQGSTPNLYLYAGEAFDSELGLYNLRARLMNPLTGRFWNADTYEGQGSDPQSLHKYNYTYNDPVNQRDPSGHAPTSLVELSFEMWKLNDVGRLLHENRGNKQAILDIAQNFTG
ncbi:MAG: RHS repeat-associated core domain-containing protein, partial [Verrucomicrobiaceae bacterium]